MLRLVSLLGLLLLLALCVALSHQRRAISRRTVLGALLLQALLAVTFLYWPTGNQLLRGAGDGIAAFLGLAQVGSSFVFNSLAERGDISQVFGPAKGFIFATMVLPTLIFFASFMAVLYHLGIMQFVVRSMAVVTVRVLGTSGAESLSACGNIFVGQTEAPLLVRPFLPRMTRSELHAVMTGGFATIAGGVFALYVGFGISPGHLMVASVMAAPAGLMVSKLLWPETEQSVTMGRVELGVERTAGNLVEAAANGALDGLRLALNVAAMLIAFLGLVAVIDWGLGPLGGLLGFDPAGEATRLSLGRILGWLFFPIAAVMGVPGGEVLLLAELLGTKIALTELVAYQKLGTMLDAGAISERTRLIASFALCGFANVGSVAIQIGGLGAIAPERKAEIARLAFRAMFAGALATCITACIAGIVADV